MKKCLYLVLAFFLVSACSAENYTTTYVKGCETRSMKSDKCSNISYRKYQFKILDSKSSVIYLDQGYFHKYKDCTIFDNKNFICSQTVENSENFAPLVVNVIDGKFIQYFKEERFTTQPVSFFEYFLYQIGVL